MTGRDLIIYILSNNLEDEPIFKDGAFIGFVTADEAAIKLGFGVETVKALVNRGLIKGVIIDNKYYIFAERKKEMNNGIKFIFGFSIGAVLGSVVTWRLAKTAYEKIVQDEIDSVKETYSRLYNKKTDKKLKTEEKEAYTAIVNNYTTKKEGGESSTDEFKPYVISPEEFGENDE